jgi:cytidyltransferase-like protein
MEIKKRKVIVSGGFDPLHVGHTRLFNDASLLGDLVVLLNSDAWLIEKKGHNFMEWKDKKEIIENLSCVSEVLGFEDDELGSANDGLIKVAEKYPDCEIIFANGGDRTSDNIPEIPCCEKHGIKMVWNIGGNKARSSSDLVKRSEEFKKEL